MADNEEIQDFLKTLAAGLEDMPKEIRQLALPEMLSASKLRFGELDFECPGCKKKIRKRVQVETPDYAAWSRAVEMIWNRVYGKPKEAPPPPPPPEEITDDRLRALIREEIRTLVDEQA